MEMEDRIRARAHSIWEQEGRPVGRDAQHWERARREIAEEDTRGAQAATARKTPGGARRSTGGLAGADDTGAGMPNAAGAEDLNVGGRSSEPSNSRPTTGRSKLAGS